MAKHDLFISFSFEDQKIAEEIVNQLLNKHKISCWIYTHDIRAGQRYKGKIYSAIEDAKILLLIQSRNSIESKEVPKEVAIAIDKGKIIIPFVIDEAELVGELAYDLQGVHRIDAQEPPFDARVDELAEEIKSVVCRRDSSSSDEQGVVLSSSKMSNVLNSKIPNVREVFEGRERELSEISNYLSSGNRILFLEGVDSFSEARDCNLVLYERNVLRTTGRYGRYIFYVGEVGECRLCSDALFGKVTHERYCELCD